MTLSELKSLLQNHADKLFQIQLPNGTAVPLSFHVTEVGRVHKTFLDCGGTLREVVTCQLQVWVGQDYHHRIETGKMAAILEKARPYLPDETIPVEVEYEDEVISQYIIEDHDVRSDAVVLILEHKHTDCLAKDRCILPGNGADGAESRCSTAGCC